MVDLYAVYSYLRGKVYNLLGIICHWDISFALLYGLKLIKQALGASFVSRWKDLHETYY